MFFCDNHWKNWNFNFETNFLKNTNLFQKTGVLFLIESTKIENAKFSYKTALSEATVKTNRMKSTKWMYYKEQSFASEYFITLLEFYLRNVFYLLVWILYPVNTSESGIKSWFDVSNTQMLYSYFWKVFEFYLRMLFPCDYKYLIL